MKRLLLSLFISSLSVLAFAQSAFELSFDAQKQANEVVIEYYIQKTLGSDVALGTANFPLIKNNDSDIDWSQVYIDYSVPSQFYPVNRPASYSLMQIAASKFVHLTILTKNNPTGNGELINLTKKRIASVHVPISGPCPEVDLIWEKDYGAINEFVPSGQRASIKDDAVFVDPANTHFTFFDLPNQPVINAPSNLSVCEGKNIPLYVSDDRFDIQWYLDGVAIDQATDTLLYASLDGKYTVSYSNCSVSELSAPIDIDIVPAPVQSVISESNGILYSSVQTDLQWFHNGVAIPNATSPELIPSNTGIYTVETYTACGNAISDPFNFAPLGVDIAENGPYLRVFPNPYIGKANIEVTLQRDSELRVEVYDLKGNLVTLVKEGYFNTGTHQLKFSAQELGWAAGTYVLKVQTDDKELVHNLIELK